MTVQAEHEPPTVVVPERLTYAQSRRLAAENFSRSLGSVSTTFDWTGTRYGALPEIVAILNWSARLRKLQKRVTWIFLDPVVRPDDETERFHVALLESGGVVARVAEGLDEIRAELSARSLYRRSRLQRLEELRRNLRTAAARIWFDSAAERLAAADLLGYLDRYKVLDRAAALNVTVTPDHTVVGLSKMGKSSETATIALRSIHSVVDVDTTVKELNDADSVAKTLGTYANLDIVRRGGLANVLVRELGNNVDDHANASAAWLCARAVSLNEIDPADPVTQAFLKIGSGYFELIVCDDGVGLTNALTDVLLSDTRDITRNRYAGVRAGRPTTRELIDYAFDRLSSTSRRHALLADDKEPQAEGVASGLYWIWNLVRGRRGVISVRTADQCAWYDLLEPHDDDDVPLPETVDFLCAGTFIRVCFPLAAPTAARRIGRKTPPAGKWRFHHVAVGDLSRVTLQLPLDGSESGGLNQHQEAFLASLEKRRDALASGDVLILDVTGMRRQWDKTTAMPLSHFFVKTNYTSAAGRVAAVLWNVPQKSLEVFEQAIETVGHFRKTKDISRFALMVSEQKDLRVFCGWAEAEEMFSRFRRDAEELTLNVLGIGKLSPDDQARFIAGVRENTHIFEFDPNSDDLNESVVRLRPWTALLRSEVWRSNSAWLENTLDKPLAEGGVLLRKVAGEGYFRLPSTDLLSREFYHFRGFFADQQAFARVSWMLAQVMARTFHEKRPEFVVAVSRPAAALARSVVERLRNEGYNTPEVLTADHVEHLRALLREKKVAVRSAVLIMTAISTGTQAAQIHSVFPQDDLEWLATFVCLDARDRPPVQSLELGLDMSVDRMEPVATGPVYCLGRRVVNKMAFDEAQDEPILSIDPVNVCPVELPVDDGERERPIFDFINDEQVLRVGHLDSDQYHHYSYYVDLRALLAKQDGLLDVMTRDIVSSMPADYDADRTVLLYPPASASAAEVIATEVQQYIGARYEFALYRDTFAGEWRFSPYAVHGLPLDGATVIIIDDGSNTGETLLGLLHAATVGKPQRIRVYLALHRLPPQKTRLFRRIRSTEDCADVRVSMATRLAIPVFSPRDCPVCRLRRDVEHVLDKAVFLHSVARETVDLLQATRTGDKARNFLWRYDDAMNAARIREDLEVCEYDATADRRLDERLRATVDQPSCRALLDLAFVLCVEPDLIRTRAIVRHAARILEMVAPALADCRGRGEAVTLACLAFYITTRLEETVLSRAADAVGAVYDALLERRDTSPRVVGQIVCVAAAESISSDVLLANSAMPLQWLQHFRIARRQRDKTDLTVTFGSLYGREALALLRGEPIFAHVPETLRNDDLVEVITRVASKIYRHSAKVSDSHVSQLLASTRIRVKWEPEQLAIHVNTLLMTLDDFEELRGRLYDVDRQSLQEERETINVLADWHTPQIEASVREIATSLRELSELVSREEISADERWRARAAVGRVASEFERLTRATDPAFDNLFPRPFRVLDRERERFLAKNRDRGLKIMSDLKTDPDTSVYFPATLLDRFIDAALDNLITSAFAGLSPEGMEKAWARVVVREVVPSEQEQRMVVVEVIDNGPSFKQADRTISAEPAEHRGHRALRDAQGLAPRFLGHVEWGQVPDADEYMTSLRMRAYKRPEGLPATEGAG